MKRLLFLLTAVASLAACNLDVPAPTFGGNLEPSNPDTETFNPILKIDLSKMTKTAAGTYFSDYSVGTGLTLTGDRQVSISYKGVLKNASLFGAADEISRRRRTSRRRDRRVSGDG